MDIAKLTSGTALSRIAVIAEDEAAFRKAAPVPPAKPDAAAEGEAAAREDERAVVERIEAMRARINASSRSRLMIEREGEAGRFVYKILDPETGETMRQWPPEKYLDLVAYLRDQQGGLVNRTA
ncbi:MAG: flagellar protein FlaG [Oceanicaulis sp.]